LQLFQNLTKEKIAAVIKFAAARNLTNAAHSQLIWKKFDTMHELYAGKWTIKN
jgi:hypothetical protein